MTIYQSKLKALMLLSALFSISASSAQVLDTLHILSYNVLYIGDTPPCQGPHSTWEEYIKNVLSYANADLVGLEKMEAEDSNGDAPNGFADSLLIASFNAAYPGRYAYCPWTNASGADNISILYYNQQKLGFSGILCSYANITDFTTYKLYYKSTSLSTTHDTTFLYVTLNHTNSGSGSSDAASRASQIDGEMAQIETHFSHLPNMINMGDFNIHTSTETAYQTLVAPANAAYTYYDPPFYPDAKYTYPANWDDNPSTYADDLTVSTRENSGSPNDCSNDADGGKSWYDHIFLSSSIINNNDFISYSPHSFKVIGNDGNRLGISVNSSPANTSAPSSVINDIYEISEHYPISLDLLVNETANSTSFATLTYANVSAVNPVEDQLILNFSKDLVGMPVTITLTDMLGRTRLIKDIIVTSEQISEPLDAPGGNYILTFKANGKYLAPVKILKK